MDTRVFTFLTPSPIVFGYGALAQLPQVVREFEAKKVCIVSDKGVVEAGWTDKAKTVLEGTGLHAFVFDEVEPEPDIRSVDRCSDLAKKNGVEVLIGLGGGSAIDVAKGASIVMKHGKSIFDYLGVDHVPGRTIPKVLIPTTAGTGSEVTPFAIFKDKKERRKTAIQSKYVVGEVAIVDPEISISCPPRVTAVCGMDAFTHAIESYTSINGGDLTEDLSLKAIQLIGENLLKAYANGNNRAARYNMSLGSLYAGLGIANAGSGAVGALSYPVEGTYNVIHGIGNSLLLPHVVKYNSVANYDKIINIAGALKLSFDDGRKATEQVIAFINALMEEFAFPKTLRALGAKKEDLKALADDGIKRERVLKNNMRKIQYEDAIRIYEMAF